MRPINKLAATVLATAGLFAATSQAVPPETIMDSGARGITQVSADFTCPGVGTLKVHLKSDADPAQEEDLGSVVLQSRTPGQNFPAMNIPFVLIGGGNPMARTVSLGKTKIEDRNGNFFCMFILATLSDTRAGVRDQLLLLQRLPFFDTNGQEDAQDVSLADLAVNLARGGSTPDFDGANVAPDAPIRGLYDGSIKVTQAKVAGLVRGSRGNERYRGRWSMRWKGVIVGGVNDGKEIRGRLTIRFSNTEEPEDAPPPDDN